MIISQIINKRAFLKRKNHLCKFIPKPNSAESDHTTRDKANENRAGWMIQIEGGEPKWGTTETPKTAKEQQWQKSP